MTDQVWEEVRTSKADELRIVNQPVRRHDAEEKVAGTTRYAADVHPLGLLHARLVRAPLPCADILRRDISAALEVPGVVAVLLGEDVPNNEIWVDVPGQETEVASLKARAQILATGRVRFQGEPVALIVADSEDAFSAAEEALDIEYEATGGVYDPFEALGESAPPVHEGSNLLAEWSVDRGDVDAALTQAAVVVEDTYTTQFVDHAYLEPEAGMAYLDDEGVITIRVSTQVVEHFRGVAKVLGVPHSKVRVIAPYVGGGFGGKEDMTVEPYLGLVVHLLKRPVRMVWTRQESLVARPKRHPMVMHYRTGAKADGTLTCQDITITADAGAYAYLSSLVLLYSSVMACGPYRTPNVRIRARAVYTNNPPCSAFRGFGGMQVVFAYESQMDRLAERLGLGRASIRKRNALAKGDHLPAGQQLLTEVLLSETIDAVLAAGGPLPEPSNADALVGRGIASNMQSYGRLVWLNDTASAWIGFEQDGSVVVRTGIQDIGAGQVSALTQIAAEVLDIPTDRITVHFGDSARTPRAGTTTATRMLYMSGNAVHDGAVALRDKILAMAAGLTGEPVETLTLAGGHVRSADVEIPLVDVLAKAAAMGATTFVHHTFFGPGGTVTPKALDAPRFFPDFTFGTHLADVEVDRRTGKVTLLNYIASHDVGRAINPTTVEGQIIGGAAQGIGQALSEEVTLHSGIVTSGALSQYLIPTAADLPEMQAVVIESGEGLGPFGARGIGEPPIGPSAAAIANAVYDATGARPTRLPMRPEAVWRLIRNTCRET